MGSADGEPEDQRAAAGQPADGGDPGSGAGDTPTAGGSSRVGDDAAQGGSGSHPTSGGSDGGDLSGRYPTITEPTRIEAGSARAGLDPADADATGVLPIPSDGGPSGGGGDRVDAGPDSRATDRGGPGSTTTDPAGHHPTGGAPAGRGPIRDPSSTDPTGLDATGSDGNGRRPAVVAPWSAPPWSPSDHGTELDAPTSPASSGGPVPPGSGVPAPGSYVSGTLPYPPGNDPAAFAPYPATGPSGPPGSPPASYPAAAGPYGPNTPGYSPVPAPTAPGGFPPGSGPYPPPGYPPPAGPYGPPGAPYPPAAYAPYGQAGGPYGPAYPQAPGPYPPAPYPSGRPPTGRGLPPLPQRTHRWGLGAYVVVEAVFLGMAALIGFVAVGGGPPSASDLALALGLPTVLAAGTALLITQLRGNGPRIDLGLQWSWRDVGLGLAFGFGGLALTIPASIIYVAIVGQDATSAVGDVFGGIRAGPALAVVIFLIVVVVAPLCEEIVYRGLLWGGVERLGGRWWAFGVTTLMFALAHLEFTRTPLLLVIAIPIALARLYTGRLLASIVAHQVNNLLPGVVLLLGLLGVVPMT